MGSSSRAPSHARTRSVGGTICPAPLLVGVKSDVVNNATCFYTNTPDNGFIIDNHPDMDKVLVVSACSGHGFKHSLAIGEAVAQLVHDGKSQIDLSAFNLARFL
jgi:sarcosine oxidase